MLYDWTITPPGGSPYDAGDLASIAIPASAVGTYSLAVSVVDGNYGGTAAATGSVKSSAPAATQPPTIEAPLSMTLSQDLNGDYDAMPGVSITAPALADVLVSVEVNYGTLWISSSAGISSAGVPVDNADGTQGWELSLSGSEQAVDAALGTLGFSLPSADVDISQLAGGVELWVGADDYTANGGALSAPQYTVMLQTPYNPAFTVPTSVAVGAGDTLLFGGADAITLSDAEYPETKYPDQEFTISMGVANGTLSLAGTPFSTATGTVSELNATLADIEYTSTSGAPDSLGMEVSGVSADNQYHDEQLTLPINPPSTTDTGNSEVLSATIATSGDMTQGSTVTATASVTGTSANSSLSYVWTVTAPDGSQVSVGDGGTITFTASEAGTYSILASVLDTTYNVSTAVTTEATITGGSGGDGGNLSASIDTDENVDEGDTVTATVNVSGASSDSDLIYTWDVTAPDGSAVDVGDGPTITFTADEEGLYTLAVGVADSTDDASASALASVDSSDTLNNIGVVRPTVSVDIGRLMGSLVGQSQANMRQTLHMLDAMAPVVAFFDEIEKGWKGAAGSGISDGGTTAQMFGEFLTWANDHESDVFVVCTANDVSSLPPEFSRAERFDATFFVDFPGANERRAIWKLYIEKFRLDAKQPKPVDADWTGAEIRACCRLAALLDVSLVEAARNVVPVAKTAAEAVERLRNWAHGRCLSADVPGIFQQQGKAGSNPGRKISRDPSQN